MAATVTHAVDFKKTQSLSLVRMELGPLPTPDSIWKIAVEAHLTRVLTEEQRRDFSVATASDHLQSFAADGRGGLQPKVWAALSGRKPGISSISIDNIPLTWTSIWNILILIISKSGSALHSFSSNPFPTIFCLSQDGAASCPCFCPLRRGEPRAASLHNHHRDQAGPELERVHCFRLHKHIWKCDY